MRHFPVVSCWKRRDFFFLERECFFWHQAGRVEMRKRLWRSLSNSVWRKDFFLHVVPPDSSKVKRKVKRFEQQKKKRKKNTGKKSRNCFLLRKDKNWSIISGFIAAHMDLGDLGRTEEEEKPVGRGYKKNCWQRGTKRKRQRERERETHTNFNFRPYNCESPLPLKNLQTIAI